MLYAIKFFLIITIIILFTHASLADEFEFIFIGLNNNTKEPLKITLATVQHKRIKLLHVDPLFSLKTIRTISDKALKVILLDNAPVNLPFTLEDEKDFFNGFLTFSNSEKLLPLFLEVDNETVIFEWALTQKPYDPPCTNYTSDKKYLFYRRDTAIQAIQKDRKYSMVLEIKKQF